MYTCRQTETGYRQTDKRTDGQRNGETVALTGDGAPTDGTADPVSGDAVSGTREVESGTVVVICGQIQDKLSV